MKRVCAWCNKQLDSIPPVSADDNFVTHSICEECASNMEFQMGVPLERYLESLSAPVIMVDASAGFVFANQPARDLLGKEISALAGQPLGNVFECAYARLPGGCGKTIHCSGCVIRSCVRRTFETGEPQAQVPASIHQTSDPVRQIEMLVSTEKVGALVQLNIVWLDSGQGKESSVE